MPPDELDETVPQIFADPGQVEQVILNLALNAKDAMPSGGALTLRTSGPHAIPSGRVPGDFVRLTVLDEGQGMSEEVKAQIFDPFFTTKAPGQGTGLGLAVVYGIVKKCGGEIAVLSQLGEGTRLDVYFPAMRATIAERPRAAAGVGRRGSELILILEDEAGVRELLRDSLERRGYRIIERNFRCRAGEKFPVSAMNAGIVPGGSTRKRIETKAVVAKSNMSCL